MTRLLSAAMAAILLGGMLSASASAADKSVGILWFGKSGLAKQVMTGFIKQMGEKAPDIKLEFKPDLPNPEAAEPIYAEWQKSKNVIVFLRSNGATYMKKNPPQVPGLVGACNNPQELGVVEKLEAPEGNITGVSYYIPIANQLAVYKQIFPNLKTIGLLLEKGHPSTPIESTGTQAACPALGLTYMEAVCADKTELLQKTKELADKCDLLIIGTQSLILDNCKGEKPVVSYSDKPIEQHAALCGLAADNSKLGQMLADSAIALLNDGKKVSEVPVKFDPEPQFLVCPALVERYKVELPEALKAKAVFVK